MSKETDFKALFEQLEKKYNALALDKETEAKEKVSLEKKVNALLDGIAKKEKAEAIAKEVGEIQKHNNSFVYSDDMEGKTYLQGYMDGISHQVAPKEKKKNSTPPIEGEVKKIFTPKGLVESDKVSEKRGSFGRAIAKSSEGSEI